MTTAQNHTTLNSQPHVAAAAAEERARLLGTPPARVVAIADLTGTTRYLPTTRFTDLSAGRVGVLGRPGMRRPGWLAADTLLALGCRDDVRGAGRPGEASWTLLAVWLTTHRIQHLFIQHAWMLPETALERLLDLLEHAHCVVWLVGDNPVTDRHRNLLAPWTHNLHSGEDFMAAWADIPIAPVRTTQEPWEGEENEVRDWPTTVPDDDFTSYRAACRDLLPTEEFQVVDTAYQHAFADARTLLAQLGPEGVTEETVARYLGRRWQDACTMAHFITTVRATQAAFFLADTYLQVDLDQLVGTATTMPRRALRSEATWRRLHAYPEPYRGAVCALAAAGMPVAEMRTLTVGNFDVATGTLWLDGTIVELEPASLPFVTAQHALRRIQGAVDGDPLLPSKTGTALSENTLVNVINTARRELGVAVAPTRQDRKAITGDRWTTRWGISLQELL
jgi:integrase